MSNPLPYAVRPADAGDAPLVAACRREWAMERADRDAAVSDTAYPQRFERWWGATSAARRTWLALPQGADPQPVGMVNATVYPRMPSPGRPDASWAYVGQLWVAPSHRRRGLGRLLMVTLLDWARQEDMVRVVLNPSEMARPLYAGLGFCSADDLMRLDLHSPA